MFDNIKAIILAASISVLVATGCYFVGHHKGYVQRDKEAVTEMLKANEQWHNKLEDIEHDRQSQLEKTSADWQAKNAALKADTDRTIADLKRDGVKLRIKVSKCSPVGASGSGQSGSYGEAELSDDSAKFLISEAKRADNWIASLQDTIMVLQGKLDTKSK